MPKETISSDPDSNSVELRWSGADSGAVIQIVTTGRDRRTTELGADHAPPSHVEYAKGICVGYYDGDGREFGGWIEDDSKSWILYFDQQQRPVVMWLTRDGDGGVEGESVTFNDYSPNRTGWFVDLNRGEINRLIKALRRARDVVFGKDE